MVEYLDIPYEATVQEWSSYWNTVAKEARAWRNTAGWQGQTEIDSTFAIAGMILYILEDVSGNRGFLSEVSNFNVSQEAKEKVTAAFTEWENVASKGIDTFDDLEYYYGDSYRRVMEMASISWAKDPVGEANLEIYIEDLMEEGMEEVEAVELANQKVRESTKPIFGWVDEMVSVTTTFADTLNKVAQNAGGKAYRGYYKANTLDDIKDDISDMMRKLPPNDPQDISDETQLAVELHNQLAEWAEENGIMDGYDLLPPYSEDRELPDIWGEIREYAIFHHYNLENRNYAHWMGESMLMFIRRLEEVL